MLGQEEEEEEGGGRGALLGILAVILSKITGWQAAKLKAQSDPTVC